MLEGSRGLLFTNEAPEVVTEWFESFKRQDFARTGNKAKETFELPAGQSPIPERLASAAALSGSESMSRLASGR